MGNGREAISIKLHSLWTMVLRMSYSPVGIGTAFRMDTVRSLRTESNANILNLIEPITLPVTILVSK